MLGAGFVLTMVRGCSRRVLSRRRWRGDLIQEKPYSSALVVVEHCEVLSGGISVRSSDADEFFHHRDIDRSGQTIMFRGCLSRLWGQFWT